MARGDVGAAIGHNAVSMLLLAPLLLVVWWAWLRRRPAPRLVAHRAFVPMFVGAVAAFTVLRNIPIAPFSVLAT